MTILRVPSAVGRSDRYGGSARSGPVECVVYAGCPQALPTSPGRRSLPSWTSGRIPRVANTDRTPAPLAARSRGPSGSFWPVSRRGRQVLFGSQMRPPRLGLRYTPEELRSPDVACPASANEPTGRDGCHNDRRPQRGLRHRGDPDRRPCRRVIISGVIEAGA